MLPCNVVLREVAGATHVSVVDPQAMFGVVADAAREQLEPVVREARAKLRRVVAGLAD